MQIVDTALAKAHAADKPVRVGVIGAGYSGRRIVYQIEDAVQGMRVVALANRTQEHALEALRFAGVADFEQAATQSAMEDAIAGGRLALAGEASWVWESEQVDVIVDATGSVEYGAEIALGAIEHDKHLVLMNVELDATLGPYLNSLARRKNLIYTNSDGDEPGVAMNLVRFVKSIGLRPVMAGNLKGLYDPYRNPTTQAEFARKINQKPESMTHFADGTKLSMELTVLANATGWGVARRGMYGPDLNDVQETGAYYLDKAMPDKLGSHAGLVDYIVGAAPHSGVFVLGYSEDPMRADFLQYLKMGDGPLYVFYTPFHLPQLEIPNTIARAALLDDAAVAPGGAPMCTTLTVAKQDLPAGTRLDGIGGYHCYGLIDNAANTPDALPMGVSEGGIISRDIRKDEIILRDDVSFQSDRLVDRLLLEQASMQ